MPIYVELVGNRLYNEDMKTDRRKIFRILIFFTALSAVLFPLFVWFRGANLAGNPAVLLEIFPAFGLLAFATMWLHIVGAPFRTRLEKYFDFGKFVSISSKVVLVSLILHPLLAFVALRLADSPIGVLELAGPGNSYLIWIAILAWVIFIGYDIAKPFKNRDFFVRHWSVVRLASTLAFFLVLVHSLGLGRDLQIGPLRYVWIFYGLTAAAATVLTYFFKKEI